MGLAPGGQPLAGAILRMGSSDFSGGGICGFAPTPASNGNRAVPPQPATANATNDSVPTLNSRDVMHMGRHTAIKMPGQGTIACSCTIPFVCQALPQPR